MTCPPQSDSQNLPVGWRFHPSDEELVDYYLKRKRLGHPIYGLDISEIQVCDYDPRDLPGNYIHLLFFLYFIFLFSFHT